MGQLVFQATLGGTTALVGPNTAATNSLTIPNASGALAWSTSALTSGRVAYAGTGGLLQDSANLTFNGTTLTAAALTSTGVATFSAGTVSAPAITTTGDTNTGIFFPAADTIAFAEGGAESMRIDSSGNVGIGTSSPSTGTLNRQLTINSGASSLAGIVLQNNATGTAFNDGFQIFLNGTTGTLSLVENSPMTFEVNGSERMRIDSSGNVGINTTSPNFPNVDRVLSVNGSATSALGLKVADVGAASLVSGSGFTTLGDSRAATVMAFSLGGTERMRIDASGNLAIGATSSRSSRLYVENAGSSGAPQLMLVDSGDSSKQSEIRFDSGNLIFDYWDGSNRSERMRIGSNGNVGIGTSSPNDKLEVNGNIRASVLRTGGTAATLELYAGTAFNTGGPAIAMRGSTTGFNPNSIEIYTSGTERMRIDSSGIVTMTAYGAGAATFSASGVISSVSDETWKTKDGIPVNPDAMLQKLEPGYWFYNEEKAPIFGAERQLGFYAQNVHEAIGKEAAPTPEEGKPWGYYDRSVLAVAVMSLKNALSTIEDLKQRIATLEAK